MNLDTVHKLSRLNRQQVIDVLNNTRTIREAAIHLQVSSKAVHDYIRAHAIARHCVYIAMSADATLAARNVSEEE